jgi:hypothetical protein
MNHELRERLMLKITVLARFRAAKRSVQKKAGVLEAHFARSFVGNINEEFDYLNEVLRQRGRQLAILEGQVIGQTSTVIEQKDQVRTMRSMMREEKEEFYTTKRRVKDIRAQSGLDRSPQKNSVQVEGRESRFIGGGFPVAGVVRKQLEEVGLRGFLSPADKRPSVLVTPHVVHPKSISMLQQRTPKGWNQNRGPLRPMLPIASESP